MAFQIRQEQRLVTNGLDGTVYVLEDGASKALAEVWPALGFNCYRWQVARQGQPIDVLYSATNMFDDTRPTRSGIPVLFPFPNRIRAGTFTWNGKEYRLPTNDSTQKNAIHGFACRKPWRIVDQGTAGAEAWLTGEFQCSKDSPESLSLWPADHRIRLTVRLAVNRLRLEAKIDNPTGTALPFGLGYHPYFRVPLTPDGKPEECQVQANASTYWELADNLPTGRRVPVDAGRNLTRPRPYSELTLDDVLIRGAESGERQARSGAEGEALIVLGSLRQEPGGAELIVRGSPSFRELVVFTPPHRQAFCLEPYTCTTDAINLSARGIDAGWIVLEPGQTWTGTFELELR